ncbi:MAG: FAD-binding protein [Alphaproteobacteria bacterium]|nr:FAD-binding protein [Alphaproteobacteria bacterium]
MPLLLIAEHDQNELTAGTLATLTAAQKLSSDVHLVLFGENLEKIAESASSYEGLKKVLVVQDKSCSYLVAETMTPTLLKLAQDYDFILAPASTFGKNVLPGLAALLDVAQISDVIEIQSQNTFKRPIYAGNAIAILKSNDAKKLLTIRPTAFEKATLSVFKASIESYPFVPPSGPVATFVKMEESRSERPDLTAASIVVAGGRGFQNKENFALLEDLADTLEAAIGASRAAVDAGFVPNDYQVGQTGKVVAPDLYIAIGISGAIQHLAGMKDSKVIVAINKDPEAPIFQVADYGLVGDLFVLLPELTTKTKEILRNKTAHDTVKK